MKHDVLVLGAGMVGTCTALHLQQRGHAVTLVERRTPGRETSYGNAGIIQREAVEPYPFPQDWPHLWSAALKQSADVNYHWGALPGLLRPLSAYWAHSRPRRHALISRAYARLIAHSTSGHQPFIEAAGAQALVQRQGYLQVFRQTSTWRQAAERAQRLAQVEGLNHQVWDGEALATAEPALRRRLAGAVHWQDPWSVSNPGALVALYATLFQQRGGRVVQGDAQTLGATSAGWRVQTADGPVEAGQAVVALGPWSDGLIRTLGYRYPLFVKRGYHQHYVGGPVPSMPVLDADVGYVLAPMQRGVRLTTGAEFATLEAPPTPVQVAKAHARASELLDLSTPVEPQPWMGARPCTADMLPVIGPAPRHRGLWFNFGHAHQGFTLGPISGHVLADLIDGVAPVVDPAPYAPARFA